MMTRTVRIGGAEPIRIAAAPADPTMANVALIAVAWGCSGDKGDHCDVGVIALAMPVRIAARWVPEGTVPPSV